MQIMSKIEIVKKIYTYDDVIPIDVSSDSSTFQFSRCDIPKMLSSEHIVSRLIPIRIKMKKLRNCVTFL